MKRGALDQEQLNCKPKVAKHNTPRVTSQVNSGAPGVREMSTDGKNADHGMDTGDPDPPDPVYNCATSNRFQILKIPIPEPKVYNVAKSPDSEKPPVIVIHESMAKVRALIPANHHYGIQNRSDGVRLYCNSVKQHKDLITLFSNSNVKYFTHPYKSAKSKRFVIYGLNTYPEELIMKDLEEYGIKPTSITNMTVKKQRYEDHATYLVYYPLNSGITLDILKKAYVIRNTIVRWNHYRSNGDGISTCSNCSQLGHSGHCNLDPKCGICSGAHTMANCEHLLNKRAYNRESIAVNLLKCPSCDGGHTVGFQQCPKRIMYREKRSQRELRQQQRFIDAPTPISNPWFNRPTNNQTRPSGNQVNNIPAVFNNPNYVTPLLSSHNNSHNNYSRNNNSQPTTNNSHSNNSNLQSDKFGPGEVLDLLNKIITCIDTCNTGAEQFQVMSNILSQHFFK